jgi:hypothetical protein
MTDDQAMDWILTRKAYYTAWIEKWQIVEPTKDGLGQTQYRDATLDEIEALERASVMIGTRYANAGSGSHQGPGGWGA